MTGTGGGFSVPGEMLVTDADRPLVKDLVLSTEAVRGCSAGVELLASSNVS